MLTQGTYCSRSRRLFRELDVTRVVMEATSDCWRPPFYLLEANGFEVWLVNARDVGLVAGHGLGLQAVAQYDETIQPVVDICAGDGSATIAGTQPVLAREVAQVERGAMVCGHALIPGLTGLLFSRGQASHAGSQLDCLRRHHAP